MASKRPSLFPDVDGLCALVSRAVGRLEPPVDELDEKLGVG